MSIAVFPDNTVFCNFAAVGRVDVLEMLLRGRGRWTAAVQAEVQASRGHLPDLRRVLEGDWMGEPLEITKPSDVRAVERTRKVVFGGSAREPLKHLGESETLHVLKHWDEFSGSWWVSDDQETLRFARYQGITTMETVDLMRHAVADSDLTANEAFALLTAMLDAGRAVRSVIRADELTH